MCQAANFFYRNFWIRRPSSPKDKDSSTFTTDTTSACILYTMYCSRIVLCQRIEQKITCRKATLTLNRRLSVSWRTWCTISTAFRIAYFTALKAVPTSLHLFSYPIIGAYLASECKDFTFKIWEMRERLTGAYVVHEAMIHKNAQHFHSRMERNDRKH